MLIDRLKSIHFSKNYPQHLFYKSILRSFKLLNIPSNKEWMIADLPCGNAEVGYNLASNKNLQIDCSDINPVCISHAKRYFARDNIRYSVSDVLDALKGKENIYDMILVLNSLFLLPKPEPFIKACHSSLKINGKLFLIIPNIRSNNFREFQTMSPSLNTMVRTKHKTIELISTLGFKNILNLDLVYASFYKRKELKFVGVLSNVYMILLNEIQYRFKKKNPSYYLLIFEKIEI